MAGDEADLITQWQQLLFDAADQVGVIAHGEIAAADRVLKQYITNKGDLAGGVVKDYMAGGMAWAVQHLKQLVTNTHLPTFHQPLVWHKGFNGGKTKHLRLVS